ncbi:MAG: BREX-1 system adenine-specific DNA-methyltransferase PglX [Deltaproteobacteria bacterium]|nr:MAG: BREX-1 system adenine-specific DNA-methyltransferase PglX [Deltaproteobacteria bacterium]
MDPAHKKILKAVSLELRHLLQGYYDRNGRWHPGDLELRLAAIGVRRDREPVPKDELPHLSEVDCEARRVVDAYLKLRKEAGINLADAVDEFVRETAYTWANRLLALRCMEARELIDEIILQKGIYGGRSLEHHRLAQREPELCTGDDDGLFEALNRVFSREAEHLPLLFDPRAPGVALRPSAAALKRCIALLSGIEAVNGHERATSEVFHAPDTLGWAYQYWNSEEKDRVFEKVRTKKGAKIEGADIIPATQLYTEPYMVKFLVQNSLGAMWMGMHPESKLYEKWEYYVRDADRAPVSKKPVKEITFLDPACGSGHFLLEAFDLLYDMYEEEGKVTKSHEICRSILENNLFGIDIDERAVQIAEVSLWMKAAEKAFEFKGVPKNLVATNICLPKGKDHLKTFLHKYPEDKPLQPALKVIFESLEHVDELGSLLQIEEPVEKELRHLKEVYEARMQPGVQENFLRPTMVQSRLPLSVESYEGWKERTLARLRDHFAEEGKAADLGLAFFGQSARKGISFFELLSRRYDIVAANPPYMGSKNMGPTLKKYVEGQYKPGKRDLYAAFILRNLRLADDGGRVAMVTQQSWMFLRSFAELRQIDEDKLCKLGTHAFKGLLRDTTIETLAHLGPGAFAEISGEVVNCVLFIFAKLEPNRDHRLTAFRLIGANSSEEKNALLQEALQGNGSSVVFMPLQRLFLKIPRGPLCYWVPSQILSMLVNMRKYSDIGVVPKGLTTGDNNRFLRYFWETSRTGERWFPYVKAGTPAKWWGLNYYCVDWEDSGIRIKSFFSADGKLRSRPQNVKYYFRQGHTYSEMAGGAMGCRVLPRDTIFDARSPGLFVQKDSPEITICLLNSRVSSYVLRTISPTLLFDQAYIPNVPSPAVRSQLIRRKFIELYSLLTSLKSRICTLDMKERDFFPGCGSGSHTDLRNHQTFAVTTFLHTLEAMAEQLAFNAFAINEETAAAILSEIDPPAGWYPLIFGYDEVAGLEISGLGLEAKVERQIKELLPEATEFVDRHSLSEQELSDIKARLRFLYEAGPGAKENLEENDWNPVADNKEEAAVGAYIPIPPETFLEELSQEVQVHPISVYWLLKEGIEKEGWRCLPEERRILADRLTVIILRLLGHRWPKQIEAGERVPDWADQDGIIPLTEGVGEPTLNDRVHLRIAEEFNTDVAAFEREFEEVMGKTLKSWLDIEFFKHHIKQFKKRPIAWQLQSGRFTTKLTPAFACFVYYHKLDPDTLPKIRSQYTGPLRQRLETELRGIKGIPADSRSARQDKRRVELERLIEELQNFDTKLKEVTEHGFGPNHVIPQLRQYAIDDAMLCLKARWLKRLSRVIQKGPLMEWKTLAEKTDLHQDLPNWIAEPIENLDHLCSRVGPAAPKAKDLKTDPVSKDLAAIICPHADEMIINSLRLACESWWKKLDEAVFSPLRSRIRELQEKIKSLKEDIAEIGPKSPDLLFKLEIQIAELKGNTKALRKELYDKTQVAKKIREKIEGWTCHDASTWEPWLSAQPMYDLISSLDGQRKPPESVQDFIRQESYYAPDINDGVRVNIAPIQKAGLLAADVLAKKDVDKAIADRAEWRADERRWCREGKLPQPGWGQ